MNKKNGFIMSTYVYILLVFFILICLTLLLVLNNTKLISKKTSNETRITEDFTFELKGNVHEYVMKDVDYIDPGFSIKTVDTEEDISDYVRTVSTVNTSEIGIYKITYIAKYGKRTKRLIRVVHVIENE